MSVSDTSPPRLGTPSVASLLQRLSLFPTFKNPSRFFLLSLFYAQPPLGSCEKVRSPVSIMEEASEQTVCATTISGDPITLFTSRSRTSAFGFHAGEVVHFTKSRRNGERAIIRGVCANGMLWFAVVPTDGDISDSLQVQTTSCRGREEYIRQYGWVVEN